MATRTTSKQAARRRAKTTAVDDRSARPRRAKAPEAAARSLAWCAAAAPADVAPYPLVAVDVLWAAVASATPYRATPAAPTAPALVAPAPERHDTIAVVQESRTPERDERDAVAVQQRREQRDASAGRQRRIALRAYAIAEASGFRMAPFDAWLHAERAIVAAEFAAGLIRTRGACRSA